MSDFWELVRKLTQPHPVTVKRDDGSAEFPNVDGLLAQLREAIFGGLERGESGASFRAKLPIDVSATDLYQQIDHEITEAWGGQFNQIPNTSTPEALLAQWAAKVDDNDSVLAGGEVWRAIDLLSSWETRISAFLNPPRHAEIQAPCPQCGVEFMYREEGGETIKSRALVFVRDADTGDTIEAKCLAGCGAHWWPFQLRNLGDLIVSQKRRHAEEERITSL